MSHDHQTFSEYCYTEHLPAGTVHNPEGFPSFPVGSYEFAPLGVLCTFEMVDGTVTDTFHVRYYPLVLACLPGAATLLWGVLILQADRKARRRNGSIRSV